MILRNYAYLVAIVLILVFGYFYTNKEKEAKLSPQKTISKDIPQKDTPLEMPSKKDSKKKKLDPKLEKKSEKKSEEKDLINEGHFSTDESASSLTMEGHIETLSTLLSNDSKDNALSMGQHKQEMLELAKNHNDALDRMINVFEESKENAPLRDALLDILSTMKDPAVEALGLKLINSGENEEKIEGYDLLALLKIPNEKILISASEVIKEKSSHPELLIAALQAMPIMPVPYEQRLEILSQLKDLSVHTEGSVRSEALFSIGKWAKNDAQITPLVEALSRDNTDDKISAMMAIESSPVVSNTLKEVLIEKMMNDKELEEIRAMSANALKRFDLTKAEYEQYHKFEKR